MKNKIGYYFFIIGFTVSIVLGLASFSLGTAYYWLWSLMIMLGFVVGFLNISTKKTKEMLLIVAALSIIAFVGEDYTNLWEDISLIGTYLKGIFNSILSFIVPATVVVGLKRALEIAKGSD